MGERVVRDLALAGVGNAFFHLRIHGDFDVLLSFLQFFSDIAVVQGDQC